MHSKVEYLKILELIYLSKFEEAGEALSTVRKTESFSFEFGLLKKLLLFRLAIKSGNLDIDIHSLDENLTQDYLLKAEIGMVKGLYYYQSKKMPEGQIHFYQAMQNYELAQENEKRMICTFNYLVGDTYRTFRNNQTLISQFSSLAEEAKELETLKTLGLSYRQLSYLYKDEKMFSQALEIGLKAKSILFSKGAISDFHLTILHLMETHIEQNNIDEALALIPELRGPFDQRVLFPIFYLQSRMGVKILENTIISDGIIDQSCSHFRRRYCDWLANGKRVLPLRQVEALANLTDLEFKFLSTLKQGPMTKNLIIEILWPDFSDYEHVNGRFHQLIHRLNKKLGGLIRFSDGLYQFQT
ncbi:MAG: hypothetical protein ACXVCY_08685 [Pseudobdellovibrionaceae bacterium]